jgi:hypothetical protein
MIRYRPHCGSFDESMKRQRRFKNRAELVAYLAEDLRPWGYVLRDDDVKVVKYIDDLRFGGNTHLVTIRNQEINVRRWFFDAEVDYYGAIGYTDGPCD